MFRHAALRCLEGMTYHNWDQSLDKVAKFKMSTFWYVEEVVWNLSKVPPIFRAFFESGAWIKLGIEHDSELGIATDHFDDDLYKEVVRLFVRGLISGLTQWDIIYMNIWDEDYVDLVIRLWSKMGFGELDDEIYDDLFMESQNGNVVVEKYLRT